jgi:hypothetical protein
MDVTPKLCKHCHNSFIPNKYSGVRQRISDNFRCRSAAKKERQASWVERNPDYFRGSENVERVREWRRKNPDWRKRQKKEAGKSSAKAQSCNREEPGMARLQDSVPIVQDPALVVFMSFVTGSVLQDEVQNLYGRCLVRGGELLRPIPMEPMSSTT